MCPRPPPLPAALLKWMFTALWKCLVPALKYLSLLVTRRKEAQSPPPHYIDTGSRYLESCSDLSIVGLLHKPRLISVKHLRVAWRNCASRDSGLWSTLHWTPGKAWHHCLTTTLHIMITCWIISGELQNIAPHFICTHYVCNQKG